MLICAVFSLNLSAIQVEAAESAASATATESKEVQALKTYKGNTTTFNAYDYYINNVDLQTAIGADGDALLKHYNEHGKAEGRVAIAATTTASAATSATATSKSTGTVSTAGQQTEASYVLNTNTKKFHYPSCKDVKKIKPENYATSSLSRDDIIAQGYSSCGHCHP